jgi:2-keto-4-pentenoate hydratase/2-oxohepta-3-ene-1,7-dioic acid hydratase in catechol pathway
MTTQLRPSKIVCVGLNYRDHAEEQNVPLPTRPLLFAKWPTTLIANGDPILIPSITQQVDYEAELGVVIGERCRRVSAQRALDVVSGYAAVNDVSARDLQFEDGQWVRGKSLDTFCPVGEVTPASEIADPQSLALRCILNGEVVQDSSTANMVFGVAEIIAFVTEAITLEAGDLIATGTPAGVGFCKTPPLFLQPGDTVRVEVEGLRAVENPVRAD